MKGLRRLAAAMECGSSLPRCAPASRRNPGRRQAAALLLLVLACSKPEPVAQKPATALPTPPAVAAAQELIANGPELGDYQFTNAAFTFAQNGRRCRPR